MNKYQRLQTYVPAFLADWIRERAATRSVSESIVIRDLIYDAWTAEQEASGTLPRLDPKRNRLFATIALDALLMNHGDQDLRDRVVQIYHRKLVEHGLASPRILEDE